MREERAALADKARRLLDTHKGDSFTQSIKTQIDGIYDRIGDLDI
jgi:hypothetical protein